MTDKPRQRLALAIDELVQHDSVKPEVDTALLEEVSQAAGFSRQVPKKETKSAIKPSLTSTAKTSAKASTSTQEKQKIEYTRRRRATGRTHPFNTKIRPETYDLICLHADQFSDQEDRPVSMAEVLERALKALNEKIERGQGTTTNL